MTHHHEWREPIKATIAGSEEIELCARFGPVQVGILGRRDFFARYLVEFDEQSNLTYIEAHPQ